jgi:hypothetical protein
MIGGQDRNQEMLQRRSLEFWIAELESRQTE